MKAIKLFVLMGSLIGLVGFAEAGTDTGCSNCNYSAELILTDDSTNEYSGQADMFADAWHHSTANTQSTEEGPWHDVDFDNLWVSFSIAGGVSKSHPVILDPNGSCSSTNIWQIFDIEWSDGIPEFKIPTLDNETNTFIMTYDVGKDTLYCSYIN